MTIGEKLAQLRKMKGFTQDEVAEKLGVTPQAVSKWENDASCPDILTLPLIADLYETTVDDILRHESNPIVTVVPEKNRKSIDDMVLRINVADGGDKVKVNLPLALVKILLESGVSPDSIINIGNVKLTNLDVNAIIKLVENGAIGRLVEVEGKDGESVIVEVV